MIQRLASKGRPCIATTTGTLPPPADRRSITWVHWDAGCSAVPDVDWECVDAVVHLAKPRNAISPRSTVENYTLSAAATFSLLSAARAHGVRRFLFASTGYALGGRDAPALESDQTFQPREDYGACKACGELITTAFQQYLSTAVLRLFFPYGPDGDRFFVNRIVRAVQQGDEIRIDGTDGVRLNPVWIDDLACGLIRAIDSDACGTFHLAGPETVTLRQLSQRIAAEVGRQPVFRQVPAARVDCHVGDMSMARSKLGYHPTCDLRSGLSRLIAGATEVTT